MVVKKKKRRPATQKDKLQKLIEKAWPKTKMEMDKAVKSTKETIRRSEIYLAKLSKKGARETQKFSLGLQKERLYYELGKAVINAGTKWKTNKKVGALLREVKKIDSKIKKIK